MPKTILSVRDGHFNETVKSNKQLLYICLLGRKMREIFNFNVTILTIFVENVLALLCKNGNARRTFGNKRALKPGRWNLPQRISILILAGL